MTEPVIRADDVSRTFGSGTSAVQAVRGVSFEIYQGECVALVGPSGSGKSTLLHLMAGLDEPTSGTMTWPAIGAASSLRPGPVGVAFQGPSLLPPLSVSENVALPLLLASGSPDAGKDEVERLLALLGLVEVADKLPEELSGGQAQRAAVARSLVGAPMLVLMDEPTGQQDGATAEVVMNVVLQRVRELGAALVVATHDEAVAERVGVRWSVADGALTTGVVVRSA
ncbi:MAG TPA: ABC transporter ATP-binding protein [Actinobacteria bacterium]|nr:ABC transporter ATP-binding protein [Actinomycetota bacterium]